MVRHVWLSVLEGKLSDAIPQLFSPLLIRVLSVMYVPEFYRALFSVLLLELNHQK